MALFTVATVPAIVIIACIVGLVEAGQAVSTGSGQNVLSPGIRNRQGIEQRPRQGALRKALRRLPRAGHRERSPLVARRLWPSVRYGGAFQYSNALKAAHITWDAISLDEWPADPEKLVPDSDMAFHLVRAEERADIIANLKQLSSH